MRPQRMSLKPTKARHTRACSGLPYCFRKRALRGLLFEPGRRLNPNPDAARQRRTIGSNVRKLVVPVSRATLSLVVWWKTRDLERDEPVLTPPVANDLDPVAAPEDVSDGSPMIVAPVEPPVMFPHQVPGTPISQALDDLQMPPMPELVEAERAFAGERVDSAWASAMEGHILGEIARTSSLQLVTLQVECRTSMCRVQLIQQQVAGAEPSIVFPSFRPGPRTGSGRAASFGNFVSTLALDPHWVASVVDRNGPPTSLAYLARREPAP